MKNYAEALLHEELSPSQKVVAQTTTRVEWLDRFIEDEVIPATGRVPGPQYEEEDASPSSQESSEAAPSEEEILAGWKTVRFGQVLPIEDVEAVIDMVSSITPMPCGCRFLTTGKADKRYCFGFGIDRLGILGRYPDAASSLEVLDKEEAKSIFRAYDREGLVHSIWTALTPYVLGLCNCDHDCWPYREYFQKAGTPIFFRAEYVCQVDWDLCRGCKSCMSQCQFGAQFYSSALSKVYIDPTRRFGCGVCRAACPNDAISSMPRKQHPEVADLWLKHVPG
jgi:ferredoxin